MALKNRYTPIIIVCGILALLIVGGQIVPVTSEELPVRLSLQNKGGRVVFTHSRHVDYVDKMGGNCVDCHHESETVSPTPLPCGSCHATEFDAKFSSDHQTDLPEDTCTRCHHAEMGGLTYSHDDHSELFATSCTDCHHDTDIEPEPGACNQCHGEKAEGDTPSLREAVHVRCENCHADMYEEKLGGCKSCHEFLPGKPGLKQPSCSSCHYETEAVPLPHRMDSFHDQCMTCHEKVGKGPFGDTSCTRCHTR
ncbi:MAG: cytochrome C [Deltaproteobacteria bacterium]|nr:cytochrome C [Deltaproteobacteria bacterium]